MNNIPLPKSNKKEDIDTTVIAIKNYLDDLRRQLGLDDSKDPDLSGFATKAELQATAEELENALSPVDVIEVDNLKAVTSNAVAQKFNQILTVGANGVEFDTGKIWYDGRKIYGITYILSSTSYTDASGSNRRYFLFSWPKSNVSRLINSYGYYMHTKPTTLSDVDRIQDIASVRMSAACGVTLTGSAYYENNNLNFIHQVDKSVYPVTEMAGRIVFEYIKES